MAKRSKFKEKQDPITVIDYDPKYDFNHIKRLFAKANIFKVIDCSDVQALVNYAKNIPDVSSRYWVYEVCQLTHFPLIKPFKIINKDILGKIHPRKKTRKIDRYRRFVYGAAVSYTNHAIERYWERNGSGCNGCQEQEFFIADIHKLHDEKEIACFITDENNRVKPLSMKDFIELNYPRDSQMVADYPMPFKNGCFLGAYMQMAKGIQEQYKETAIRQYDVDKSADAFFAQTWIHEKDMTVEQFRFCNAYREGDVDKLRMLFKDHVPRKTIPITNRYHDAGQFGFSLGKGWDEFKRDNRQFKNVKQPK